MSEKDTSSPPPPAKSSKYQPDDPRYEAYLRAKSRVYHAKKYEQEHGIPDLNTIANSPWRAFDALALAFGKNEPTVFEPVDDKEFTRLQKSITEKSKETARKPSESTSIVSKMLQALSEVDWKRWTPLILVLSIIIYQTKFSFEASIAKDPVQSVQLFVGGIFGPWFPSMLLKEIEITSKIPKNSIVLDVRTSQTVAPLPESLHIPLNRLVHHLDQLSEARYKQTPIIVTCLNGLERDCIQAAMILRDSHHRAGILKGGVKAWHRQRDEL